MKLDPAQLIRSFFAERALDTERRGDGLSRRCGDEPAAFEAQEYTTAERERKRREENQNLFHSPFRHTHAHTDTHTHTHTHSTCTFTLKKSDEDAVSGAGPSAPATHETHRCSGRSERTVTLCPLRRSASAAARPDAPLPTTATCAMGSAQRDGGRGRGREGTGERERKKEGKDERQNKMSAVSKPKDTEGTERETERCKERRRLQRRHCGRLWRPCSAPVGVGCDGRSTENRTNGEGLWCESTCSATFPTLVSSLP